MSIRYIYFDILHQYKTVQHSKEERKKDVPNSSKRTNHPINIIFTWRVNLYPYFFLNESKSLQWPYLPSSLVMDVYKERLFTLMNSRGRRGLDRMVVGFTTTYAISAFHY